MTTTESRTLACRRQTEGTMHMTHSAQSIVDTTENTWTSGKPITPQEHHNYVAFFLTLACNLSCPWCINSHEAAKSALAKRKHMSAEQWIAAANRFQLRSDLPITLQGGEPTIFAGFYRFVNEADSRIQMDLMTNLQFNVETFIANVPVSRFSRQAPYAPIRASYHPGQNDAEELMRKALALMNAGFRIGLYAIDSPDPQVKAHIDSVMNEAHQRGIDFRLKEYLGFYQDRLLGAFKYTDSVGATTLHSCQCRTTEFLVDPSGHVFRCHADLYNGKDPIAHILDEDFDEASLQQFRPCDHFGTCNPCDVKIKTNRFQVFGHTSVEIENIV